MTRVKPPYGSSCNSCGGCCLDRLCPMGVKLFEKAEGPCPALVDGEDGALICGLVKDPKRFAPVQAFVHGEEQLRQAAMIIIEAGVGCDAQLEGERVDPGLRLRMRRQAARNEAKAQRAWKLWV
jgi:hypothetical protein